MHSEHFQDFDAFSESVRDLDCTMMLQNPARRSWHIRAAEIAGLRVQMGQLGSGNIVEGQSWASGILLYLPLTNACEYAGNGDVLARN